MTNQEADIEADRVARSKLTTEELVGMKPHPKNKKPPASIVVALRALHSQRPNRCDAQGYYSESSGR